jgi:dTDP-4-amino-4,6-dideoxygalactose transaminase
MEVQFLNLKRAYNELKPELDQLWHDINEDSFYIYGSRLTAFEGQFAKYLGVKQTIGVANGLDALVLSIKALGIIAGDEVIVPAHTYIASWLAISNVGAIPVPVEVDNMTYLIDPTKIEQAITSKTKAIMPVHLYGRICEMAPIMEIATKHNLKIIEDAAQAHGAFDIETGKKAGTFGDTAGFSFYPGKNLGCFGDGGCVSTNDDKIAETIRLMGNYGSKIRYQHEMLGVNSRLDELQAGVVAIKLKVLDEWNSRRRKIAKMYLHELKNIGDLVLPEDNRGHVWHIFSVRTSKRDQLKEFLASNGIGVNIHYPKPIHLQPAYQYMNIKAGSFTITEKISKEVLSLPMGPHLTDSEAAYCVSKVKEFFR